MMMLSPVYAEGTPDEAVSTAFNIAPVHWDKNIAAVDVCGAPVEGETEPASDSSTTVRNFAYNHLGQLVQVIDAAGERTLGYNGYGEQETDSLQADGVTHLITELRDAFGRSTGYVCW